MQLCYLVEFDMLVHFARLPKHLFTGVSLDSEVTRLRLIVTHAEIFQGGLDLSDGIQREGLATVAIIDETNWTESQQVPERLPPGVV